MTGSAERCVFGFTVKSGDHQWKPNIVNFGRRRFTESLYTVLQNSANRQTRKIQIYQFPPTVAGHSARYTR